MSADVAVFFDIGDTLASAVVEAGRLAGLEVYPFVPEVLGRLGAGADGVSVALGLISNTGHESAERMSTLLAEAGLSDFVAPHLCLFSSVEGLDKSQRAFFALAEERAGLAAARCVYVGEDAGERAVAASAHFQVSPHPLHALHLVEREFFVR
jgi:FMN phosphatase YigB (HAD superfamily)